MADTSTSGPGTDNSADEPAPKRKFSLRLLLIIAATLLVGAAEGGLSVFFILVPTGEGEENVAELEVPVEEMKNYRYLPLDPLVVHAVDELGVQHATTVIISLEIDYEGAELGYYERLLPRVHDSILRSLHRPTMHLQPEDGRLSIDELKQRAAAASAAVLGAGFVNAVLIQGAL